MDPELLRYYREVQAYDWTDVADRWYGPETILHRWRSAVVRRLIVEHADPTPWLDVGCGTGLCSRYLPPNSIGVDVNPRNLERLRLHAPHIIGKLGEAEELPFPNRSFRRVLATEILEHFPDPAPAVREIRRVLTDDGMLIGTTPRTALLWNLRGCSRTCRDEQREPFHTEFRGADLRALLEGNGFAINALRPFAMRMQWLFVAHVRSI